MSDPLMKKRSSLNKQQDDAVVSMIEGWNSANGEFILPVVEGPPGTGKTTVGVIAALTYCRENKKNQVCYLCYTHQSADGVLKDLREYGATPDEVVRVVDVGKGFKYSSGSSSDFYIAFDNDDDLSPNDKRLLKNKPIIISTLHGSGKSFKYRSKPLIIVDEFSQVPPTMFFSTVHQAKKNGNPEGYVLLGDSNQLPVITSQSLLRPNIGNFITTKKDYEPHELCVQFRMHSNICDAVNALRIALKSYELKTAEVVGGRDLTALGYRWNPELCSPELHQVLDPRNPTVIINTDFLPGFEEVGLEGSKFYPSEAQLAANIAQNAKSSFINSDGNPLFPTLLSPYTGQVGTIRSMVEDSLQKHCITIYSSQGREYPMVIVSFARKNPSNQIGFLGEPQLRAQSYVACSRAMGKLIVMFSFSTFRGYEDYDILLDRCKNALIVESIGGGG
jgi:hypothetical protein